MGAILSAPVLAQQELADEYAWSLDGLPVQELDLPEASELPFYVDLEIDGVEHLLELVPYSLRSDDFVLRVQEADGLIRIHEAPAPATFRGRVLEIEGSEVRASLARGQLTGIVDLGGDERYAVQPESSVNPGAARRSHVVYHHTVGPQVGSGACGAGHAPIGGQQVDGGQQPLGASTGLIVAEVAFDTDVQYFQDNGSSLNNSINDIENVMNSVEGIYESDINLTFEITQILVRTSEPDPYSTSDPSGLLGQFGAEWGQNQSGWKRDITHLMTGRNLNGSTIGIASLGCACGLCFGLSESTFTGNFNSRVGLTAHEMGHQFGAPHCNGAAGGCFIMCSGLGGCNNSVSQFGPASINTLNLQTSFDTCLTDLGFPVAPPIAYDFPDFTIDSGLFLVNDQVGTSTAAQNEPSSPRSAQFTAQGPLAHQQDELWTNDLLLQTGGPWFVSFFTQRNAVLAGGALVLEYRNSQGDWVEVTRLVSDGTDQGAFVQSIMQLPAGANHDHARLRFRTEFSSSGQSWFVDDFSLSDVEPCPAPVAYCTGKLNSDGCVPYVAPTGFPSLTSNSQFFVTALEVPAQKPGLMLYGYAPAALPFQDGLLCSSPPNRRTDIQQSEGLFGVPCDGLLTFDMNAHIQSGIDPFLVLGSKAYCQYWYRDQGVASGTGLSNALEIEICD